MSPGAMAPGPVGNAFGVGKSKRRQNSWSPIFEIVVGDKHNSGASVGQFRPPSHALKIIDDRASGEVVYKPLRDWACRAFLYTAGAVTGEKPELLDPCEMDDWRALGCMRENGKPCPAGDDPVLRKRAETSIRVLHLHHEPTCKLRHARAVTLMADIDEARRLFTAARTDPAREPDFKKAAQRILRSIARKSEFSGDMRFLLGGERTDDHPWIQGLLET